MLENLEPLTTRVPYSLISIDSLARYTKNITDRTQMCKISILGSQGTGKTNVAVAIAQQLNRLTDNNITHIYMRGMNIISFLANPHALEAEFEANDKEYLTFILDDFSYVLDIEPQLRNLIKHNYTKLRHIFTRKKLIVLMTIHYKKAIQPLLRDTFIRVLTHMNNEFFYEIKNNYKLALYAKNFLKYISYYYIYNKPFICHCSIVEPHLRKRLRYHKTTSFGAIYRIENNRSGNNDSVLAEIVQDVDVDSGDGINLVINDANERLGMIDFGVDVKYLYYNIIYNAQGKFELDNVYVINNAHDDENFMIQGDDNKIIALEVDNSDGEYGKGLVLNDGHGHGLIPLGHLKKK